MRFCWGIEVIFPDGRYDKNKDKKNSFYSLKSYKASSCFLASSHFIYKYVFD